MNKPRLTRLTDLNDILYLEAHRSDLGVPTVFRQKNGEVLVDADELRAWRSQNTSAAKQGD